MSETTSEVMPAAHDQPGRGHRRVRIWHVAVAVLIVLVAALVGLRCHWRTAFRRRIEAIAAAGYPVMPEELDASYVWPESGDNAADWVVGAGTYFVDLTKEESQTLRKIMGRITVPPVCGPLAPEVKGLLVRHVEANAKVLELLHEGVGVEESRYPIDLSKGEGTLITHIGPLRNGCELLCFEAVLCAERGDSEGAVRALDVAFWVADTLRAEPLFISQLVRMSIQLGALRSLERTLSQIELSDAELRRLTDVIAQAPSPDAMRLAVTSSRCTCLELFQRPQAVDPTFFENLPPVALLELYAGLGLAARDGIAFLDTMDECLTVLELPLHQRCRAADEIETRLLDRCDRNLLLKNVSWVWHGFKIEVRYLASLRCGLTALAVERYRLAKGGLPRALSELVPDYLQAVPDDPCDGKPLRYERLDGGFMVYSVGQDGLDDGGKECPPSEERGPNETYDITFTVQR